MRSRFTGLWRHPDFIRLWIGQSISQFGSHIGGGALQFTAILILGAMPFQISLLAAAQIAPALVLGLPAGVWADRLRRRPILIACDIGRAALLLSIPVAYLLDVLSFAQLYLVAAAVGALTICFDVAYQAFLPSVVRRDELVEGNSKLGLSDSLAEIAGPPLGGILVQIISAPLVIALDALSFLLSGLSIGRIQAREPAVALSRRKSSVWREAQEGMGATWRNSLLRVLLIVALVRNVSGGIIGALYSLYLIRDLGLAPALVGLSIGVGGLAALLGALMVGPVVARWGVGPAIGGALAISGVAALLIPLAHGPAWMALAMIFVAQSSDMAYAVYSIAGLSLRQSVTAERLLGRVNASFGFLTAGAGLIGALIGGALGELVGLRAALALGALGSASACLWVYFSPLRGLRRAPEPDGPHPVAAGIAGGYGESA